jgi:uncharacterized protein (DUF1697 family)
MPVVISMLRGVNLGSHRRVKMEVLRTLYESLKLRDIQTYVQSGNVIFKTDERDMVKLVQRIEAAIGKKCGFQCDVMVRSAAEMRDVIARNPFAKRRGIEPNRLLVTFLNGDPGDEARKKALAIKTEPEELHLIGREAYIYYPNGMARPKLSWPAIERILQVSGTGRNWNSVMNMMAMAEKMEAAK